jgi:hypothetical protein
MGKVTVPFIGMIIAECVQVALIILSKQVMSKGMTSFIFIFYSNSIAALVLLPSSFFIHRFQLPPITFSTLSAFFILGLLGQVHSFIHLSFFVYLLCLLLIIINITMFIFSYFAQVFGYAGINYSSSTLATAMLNLVPGFTFILAVLFRFILFNSINYARLISMH